jgi:hypothetical protein
MLWNKLIGASSAAAPVQYLVSTFITNQSSDATRTLTLSSGFAAGDMLVSMTGNRAATPPTLLSGYTAIVSVTAANGSRSQRLQYKIAASSSETISWTGAYGYLLVLRNATRIGRSGVVSTSALSTVPLPELSDLDTSGRGFILAGSYPVGTYSGVTAPYTLLLSGSTNLGAFIQQNTDSSLVSKTLSGVLFNSSYAAEFLP